MLQVLSIVLMTQLCVGDGVVEVEFIDKVVGDHKYDGFAVSLATSYGKLAIGAPWGNNERGSVMVDQGMRINGPRQGRAFGAEVDVNQHFIVVSGRYSVYVHESNSPYNLKAKLPMDGFVRDAIISEDNTIAVSNSNKVVVIFHYDGQHSWHVAEKLKLELKGESLAISGSTLVVGALSPYYDHGVVYVFNNKGGKWVKTQIIQQQGVHHFGLSVTIDGRHMAVGAWHKVFIYQQDATANKWIENGQFSVKPSNEPGVSMQKDTLVATFSDDDHPTVSGYVYKLSTNKNDGNVTSGTWIFRAVLTTKTDLVTSPDQTHRAVSVEGRYAFIGRYYDSGFGKVFVYDLADISDSS